MAILWPKKILNQQENAEIAIFKTDVFQQLCKISLNTFSAVELNFRL